MSHAASSALPGDFEASYPELVRFLTRRTGSADDARELAHDAWLRLAAAEAPPQGVRHARAYLFGAAQHLAIDHLRRTQRRAEFAGDAALCAPAQVADVADRVAHRQALQAVERALQALPARAREAFLSHRLDGAGHDELAACHGVSRSTIERDVQRAHEQMQTALERWHGGSASAASPSGRRRSLGALLGLFGVAGAGPLLWQVWRRRVPQWQQALVTPRGRITRMTLPDGSTLTLDADSALDIAFYGARRQVRLLRGAAFFAVARDVQRPFTVQAGAALVTVLGTRFAVELESDAVIVAVESGRVRVEPQAGAPALELGAGESLHIAAGQVRREPAVRPVAGIAAWRDGWLSFERVPLAQAVERIGRYRAQPVEVDERVAALPVSGEVRIAQADEWLRLLPDALPVRVQQRSDGRMRVEPR